MRFGTYHTSQCPPGFDEGDVFARDMERIELAEALGYDDVWLPEQHFTPYCMSNDALLLAAHAAARTKRVRIGTAVVNLSYVQPLRFAESAALVDRRLYDAGVRRVILWMAPGGPCGRWKLFAKHVMPQFRA
jgi:hypothetical protein